MTDSVDHRCVRVAACAAILALLPSCFTTALWGGDIDDEDGDGSSEIDFDPEVDGAGDLLFKLVLTPVTVVLDICTSPVQAWMFGWEDDDEDDC